MVWNLQKYIASAGVCSRRKAEEFIRSGRIRINDAVATVTDRVQEEDIVTFDGRLLTVTQAAVYFVLNKPPGYICTHAQFPGEKSIYELLPRERRLFSVGRLDRDSTGMLLLTTDGALAQQLTHPRYAHEKEYLVKTKNKVTATTVAELMRGVDIGEGDGVVRPAAAYRDDEHTLRIILQEGKKRQIRRMLAMVHVGIATLQRIRIGALSLQNLAEGKFRELTADEVVLLTRSRNAT